jgi:hypothetical protein
MTRWPHDPMTRLLGLGHNGIINRTMVPFLYAKKSDCQPPVASRNLNCPLSSLQSILACFDPKPISPRLRISGGITGKGTRIGAGSEASADPSRGSGQALKVGATS